MAGVKGKCGGARPNSGGARPGAGRKPKPKPPPESLPAVVGETPLEFLLRVQNDPNQPPDVRLKAAITAAPFVHARTGDGGKKGAQAARAKEVGSNRLAPASPPRLAVVGGR